jgi:ACS family D-galactonate transporter-like MFS transporter
MATVLPAPQQAPARPAATSWRIVPLVMVVIALAHFNRLSISVAGAEQIISPEGVTDTMMGPVYSSFLLVYTLFMVPGGWFIDRFGPRRAWLVLGFGSAVFVTLTGVVGLLCTQPLALVVGLLLVRSLLGATNAPLHPTGARLVGNWIPPSGIALANGLVTAAALFGMAATYLVFGGLMDAVGWRGAFLVMGGVTLVVALAWAALGADYPAGRSAPSHATHAGTAGVNPAARSFLARALGNRSFLCLTLSYGALSYFQYLFFYWAQYYFEKILKWSNADSRLCSTLLNLAMGAGMVLGGWLSDRARRRLGLRRGLALVPLVGFLASAAAVVVGLSAAVPAAIVTAFAVAMAAAGLCEGSFWTTALLIGGRRGGTAAAVMNTGGNGVGLLAPIFTPLISQWLGWQAGLGLASLACVLGAVLWLPIDPDQRLEGTTA